ncbi:MAG: serine/threonine-protein kinase [Pirellulaceae bacterium]|nr:serine/threonine-protein kinase [Pirellulaceae bacterium]
MSSAADRNLLFGILALQLDFITREQLIIGMQAWVLAKERTLADLLQEAGSLLPENRAALEVLVAAHVKKHQNDPQQSLAAISSASDIHDELSQIADPQLDASLPHIAAAARKYRSLGDVPTQSVGESTSAGMRFRIVRPHAQGGLGKVSVARDAELNREVALKEIRPQYADDPGSRSRFMLEAEVTGGLEHPGIVPVYGLGTYPNGRPFYAMRFIRGDSLKEAIARFHDPEHIKKQSAGERAVELRQLLGRLIDVCQAIQYAHDRGVLHRDLKPGNIMLGKYGETLVVDWGLAKAQGKAEPVKSLEQEAKLAVTSGSSSEPTQMGSVVGTLQYMSPEQAAGRLDLLGPATDVFALGATLYHILVGQAPYQQTTRETLLAAVQKGEFPPPRRINPRVPKTLAAICMKAMAREPGDRYISCSALVADLEHWLADEPTSAYRESLRERFLRWRRKHPRIVAGFAATLLIGVVASTVTSLILAEKNRAVEAESRRTFKAVAFFSATLSLSTPSETGLDILRRAAQNALNNSFDGDLELQIRVLERLSYSMENVYLHEENLAVREKILTLASAIQKADQSNVRYARERLAVAYQQAGRPEAAISLLEPFLDRDVWTTMPELSRAYVKAGRFKEGVALYERMLTLKKQFYGNNETRCADLYCELGNVYLKVGRTADAVAMHESAVRGVNAKGANGFEKREYLADAYRAAGRFSDVIKTYQELKSDQAEVYGPVNVNVSSTCQKLGMTFLAIKDFENAELELMLAHRLLCDPSHVYMRAEMVPPCMEGLIALYDQWGKQDEKAKWQQKLAAWIERMELVPVSTTKTEEP